MLGAKKQAESAFLALSGRVEVVQVPTPSYFHLGSIPGTLQLCNESRSRGR
ncbi:hypothetical protein QFZ77_007218 [Paenibacillus sp. V4I3]|nr:hypothetical protein [Paenibacillus sp. V4I3]